MHWAGGSQVCDREPARSLIPQADTSQCPRLLGPSSTLQYELTERTLAFGVRRKSSWFLCISRALGESSAWSPPLRSSVVGKLGGLAENEGKAKGVWPWAHPWWIS